MIFDDLLGGAEQQADLGLLEHTDVVVGITRGDDFVVQRLECLHGMAFRIRLPESITGEAAVVGDLQAMAQDDGIAQLGGQGARKLVVGIGQNHDLEPASEPGEKPGRAGQRRECAGRRLDVLETEIVLGEDLQPVRHQLVVVGNVTRGEPECVDAGPFSEADPDLGHENTFEIEAGDAHGARVYQSVCRTRKVGAATRLAALLLAALLSGAATAELRVAARALFKDRAVLTIDGAQRTLRAGETSPEGVTLVSASAESAVVELDGQRLELALDGRISGAFPEGPARKVVRLVEGDGGHYFVDGQINGNPVSFLVDTGATSVAMNKHTARRLGIAYKVDGHRGSVRTASGIAPAYGVVLDEVKVHSLTLRRVRGTVIDGDYPEVALLGQSVLNRLDIHREGSVLELRER